MNSRLVHSALRTLRGAPLTATPIAARRFTTSSPKMTVHVLKSVDQFKETIQQHPAVVIDASATWCGPCRVISPLFEGWSEDSEFGSIYFAKFDVDEVPDLAGELGIRAMPTFIFFKGGNKVNEFTGASPPAVQNLLRDLIN
ncbi:hypothetical protein VTH06DRAFT_266 [Thermothelomyces fergusii]